MQVNKPLVFALAASAFAGGLSYLFLIHLPEKNRAKIGDGIVAKKNGVRVFRKSDNGIYRTAEKGDYILMVYSEDENYYYGLTASNNEVYVSRKDAKKFVST